MAEDEYEYEGLDELRQSQSDSKKEVTLNNGRMIWDGQGTKNEEFKETSAKRIRKRKKKGRIHRGEDDSVMFGTEEKNRALMIRKESYDNEYGYGPENDEGNIEYKLRLVDVTDDRLDHLTTQMKFRLEEGHGLAFYRLGVSDEGFPHGLPSNELQETLKNIKIMAKRLGATTKIERVTQGQDGKILKLLVYKSFDSCLSCIESRVVVIGVAESGKTTLIGSLTTGLLDDGNGLSRIRVFRHRHEILDGRTSSVALQLIGFGSKGRVLTVSSNDVPNYPYTPSEDLHLIRSSSRLVILVDIAGAEKYVRSALRGLCGAFPDACLVVHRIPHPSSSTDQNEVNGTKRTISNHCSNVFSNHQSSSIKEKQLLGTKQSLCIAIALGCQTIVALTGSDEVCDKQQFIDERSKLIQLFDELGLHPDQYPLIVVTSSVTGEGLQELRQILYNVPNRIQWSTRRQKSPIFIIEEIYNDVVEIGLVVCGILIQGQIRQGDLVVCGPFDIERKKRRRKRLQRWSRKNYGNDKIICDSDGGLDIKIPPSSNDSQNGSPKRLIQLPNENSNKLSEIVRHRRLNRLMKKSMTIPTKSTVDCQDQLAAVTDNSDEDYDVPTQSPIRWKRVRIQSIQIHRVPVQIVSAGQSCSFCIEFIKPQCNGIEPDDNSDKLELSSSINRTLRVGMVLVNDTLTACASTTMKFTALLTLLPGSKNLERQSNVESRLISDRRALTSLGTSPYEVLFFVQYVRQPAVVVQVLNESGWLKSGDTCSVVFHFMDRPEFVIPSMPCSIWTNELKGCGTILSILR